MRNRNVMNSKLDNLETTLINLQRIVNTQEPIKIYKQNINKAIDLVEDLRGMVEMEPMSPNEINKY
jgi:hypothetical protein